MPTISEIVGPWPISKFDKDKIGIVPTDITAWHFVELTEPCTYKQAMARATELQSEDSAHKYYIWDCR